MKKRITAIALALALVLVLCSCGSSQNNESNTNSNSSNSGFNYSASFDENGYWKDIKASEYVTLPDGLDKIELKQADIDEQIAALLDENLISVQVKDREVKDKDSVNIDYVGSIDGVEFDGGSTSGKGTDVTIGVTSYIDDFLEQLIGHKPGDTFDVNVTFPDPYENNPDLAGKDAVFVTTINYITEKVRGEWNDTFVEEKFSGTEGWKTAAEAEEAIKDFLIESYLFDNSKFLQDVPQAMLDFQKNSAMAYYQRYADAYTMTLDDFITYYLKLDGQEGLWENIKEDATTYCKYNLIYQALAEKSNYTVSEDEIKAYFMEANGTEDYSESEKSFGLPYIKFMVMSQNMIKGLTKTAKVVK